MSNTSEESFCRSSDHSYDEIDMSSKSSDEESNNDQGVSYCASYKGGADGRGGRHPTPSARSQTAGAISLEPGAHGSVVGTSRASTKGSKKTRNAGSGDGALPPVQWA